MRHLEDILPNSTLKLASSNGKIVLMDLGKNKWSQPTDDLVNSGFIIVANLLATRFF